MLPESSIFLQLAEEKNEKLEENFLQFGKEKVGKNGRWYFWSHTCEHYRSYKNFIYVLHSCSTGRKQTFFGVHNS